MKIAASPTHVDWNPYRKKRNTLLAASDRYMLPDFPISEENRALVATYRQQLRDMFAGLSHPEQAVYPPWPI